MSKVTCPLCFGHGVVQTPDPNHPNIVTTEDPNDAYLDGRAGTTMSWEMTVKCPLCHGVKVTSSAIATALSLLFPDYRDDGDSTVWDTNIPRMRDIKMLLKSFNQ